MSYRSVNPFTGEVNATRDYLDWPAVDAALESSELAFPGWASLSFEGRATPMRQAGRLLLERKEVIANIMTREMGKLTPEAIAEVEKCAGVCEFYADNAASFLQDEHYDTDASDSFVAYEPLGCLFAIMPWNFPIWQVFRYLAPALMAGNVTVLKHAENVPLCAEAIAQLMDDAGFPDGVFTNLFINNDTAAEVIADERVHCVTLTGSEQAGVAVASNAGKHLKKSVMELGGSDPFIVLDDADLDAAVEAAIKSRFSNAGQTCIAAKRFILQSGIAADFTERFKAAAAALQPGDPSSEKTTLAPMARSDLRDGLQRQVEQTLAAGAEKILGCEPDTGSGCIYPASIIGGVKPGMPAYHEELFGPVATLYEVADDDAAIALANDTAYGLGASIWTQSNDRAMGIARQLEHGAVFVNSMVRSDPRLPFGGVKRSGYGRELSAVGIREFMNAKTVYVS